MGSSTGAIFVSSKGSSTAGSVRREDVDDIIVKGRGRQCERGGCECGRRGRRDREG